MASEFLLVTPGGWIELENAPAQFTSQGVDMNTVINQINGQEWVYLSGILEELGLLESNELILDARVVNTEAGESNYRFWYVRA